MGGEREGLAEALLNFPTVAQTQYQLRAWWGKMLATSGDHHFIFVSNGTGGTGFNSGYSRHFPTFSAELKTNVYG